MRGLRTLRDGSSAATTWWTSRCCSEEVKTLVSLAHGNASACTEEQGILQREHNPNYTGLHLREPCLTLSHKAWSERALGPPIPSLTSSFSLSTWAFSTYLFMSRFMIF